MKIELPIDSRMRSSDFVYGVATSAFQIEGGAASRLPSIWDTFCARSGAIRDGSNGHVACDHYHRWEEDLNLLVELGVDAYRLSLAWPRVIKPDGGLNQQGIDFYRALLDGLQERGIKSFVTLYHWDLPQWLEARGGWQERDTAKRFADYVDVTSRALGDRVYSYATLNEPFCSAYLGHEVGTHAPGIRCKRAAKHAAHHLLLAHGLAMQVLVANSPQTQNGIVLNFTPAYPASDSAADHAAAALADETYNRWYADPVLLGRYPELIERLPADQVPVIHDDDLQLIAHPIDYLGVNYYTRGVYAADEIGGFRQLDPAPPHTAMGWEIYPQGLTDLLAMLNERYDLPPVFIAENGAAVPDTWLQGRVDDPQRTQYLQQHLLAVDQAVRAGCEVAGYFCWSLMDNFEWAEGYSKHFGLVHIDYETQQRTIKSSGYAYRDLLQDRTASDAVDLIAMS